MHEIRAEFRFLTYKCSNVKDFIGDGAGALDGELGSALLGVLYNLLGGLGRSHDLNLCCAERIASYIHATT